MWSEAEDALLREQWPIASASLIATMIPRTRNAIIGRAARLRLRGKPERLTPGAWSEAEVAILRRLWAANLTAPQIAEALRAQGFIRKKGNVSDKATRLGLPSRRKLRAKVFHFLPSKKRAALMRIVEPITPLNIPFLDIEFGQCRAITDATRDAQRCCGHPVDERGTYCAAHRAVFYTPSRGKGA